MLLGTGVDTFLGVKREDQPAMMKVMRLDVDQELDIKGEVCLYTFVKSKLALEMMESGQVLRVIVDHLPAVENVPRSLENEGNEILDVRQVGQSDWAIIVRKG
jgi:tRNA 2-thiouridine synthesizing protein A